MKKQQRKGTLLIDWKFYSTPEQTLEHIKNHLLPSLDSDQTVYLALPYSLLKHVNEHIKDERLILGSNHMTEGFIGSIAGQLFHAAGAEFVLIENQDPKKKLDKIRSAIDSGMVAFVYLGDHLESELNQLKELHPDQLKRFNLIFSGKWKKDSRIPDAEEVKLEQEALRQHLAAAFNKDLASSIEIIQELSPFLDEDANHMVADGLFFDKAACVPEYLPHISQAVKNRVLDTPYKRFIQPVNKPEPIEKEENLRVNDEAEAASAPKASTSTKRFIVERELEEIDERFDEELEPPIRYISDITSYGNPS